MTANPFAALLDGVRRYSYHDYDEDDGFCLRERDVLAALAAAVPADLAEAGPPFFFDRYINGVRMAEDVCVERETTLEGAMRVAARIAAKGPNGEPPVLVYRSTETAALAAERAKTTKLVEALREIEGSASPDHWVPEYQHCVDVARAAITVAGNDC